MVRHQPHRKSFEALSIQFAVQHALHDGHGRVNNSFSVQDSRRMPRRFENGAMLITLGYSQPRLVSDVNVPN